MNTQKAKDIVERIGPCTTDIRDCEVMRSAIALAGVSIDNEPAQALRSALAQVACLACRTDLFPDIEVCLPLAFDI